MGGRFCAQGQVLRRVETGKGHLRLSLESRVVL